MKTIPGKSWTDPVSSSKKYMARLLTHKLSTKLNADVYDVVFETPLKAEDFGELDVVVFDKCHDRCSIMAIEICKSDEVSDMFIIGRDLMENNSLLDFFLYDIESETWYNIKKGKLGYEIYSNTMFMEVALDKLKD